MAQVDPQSFTMAGDEVTVMLPETSACHGQIPCGKLLDGCSIDEMDFRSMTEGSPASSAIDSLLFGRTEVHRLNGRPSWGAIRLRAAVLVLTFVSTAFPGTRLRDLSMPNSFLIRVNA